MATNADIVRRLGKLQSTLLTSGIQKSNQPLFQVINQLIQAIIDSADDVVNVVAEAQAAAVGAETFLTAGDELATLPSSSQIVAGDNVSFDTSVSGQLRIDVSIPPDVFVEWSVLTNGDAAAPEIIFAGGDVIMTHIP